MNLLFLTFLFPLTSFILLTGLNKRLSENQAAVLGVGSLLLSALTAAWVGFDFIMHKPESGSYVDLLWTWISIGDFKPEFALHLDGLSLTMLCVVTGVGFFIHLFASWYMRGDDAYARFFSYMNLFIASMLFLVLSDNLVFVYLGWEGVGLCSYLLIGFYFRHVPNGMAAFKSFLVTRVGDTFMIIGLFALYDALGSLNIQTILARVPDYVLAHPDSQVLSFAALMLLGGAVGKSAQLPLQTWLPDAMAGPTPVSALIHAATMVTAGVYLIARTHALFIATPDVLMLVGAIGGVTLLLAGFTALVQSDIKRILAYSTMSQIGYMFLALGVGAWHAAIFHLMTHAFFKALLFLSAGAVIVACHHEQNIFKMGGLRKKLPLIYACFLVGGAALVALPYITAGFYSKDEILWEAFAGGHTLLFAVGLLGAFMTALYTFRLIFIVFHGEAQADAHEGKGISYVLPLAVLLVLSTVLGGMIHPPLQGVLPSPPEAAHSEKIMLELVSGVVVLLGIALSAYFFLFNRKKAKEIAESRIGRLLSQWWRGGFGFDYLYDRVFVKPYVYFSELNRDDAIDKLIELLPRSAKLVHEVLSVTQNGRVRWYLASMAAGAIIVISIAMI